MSKVFYIISDEPSKIYESRDEVVEDLKLAPGQEVRLSEIRLPTSSVYRAELGKGGATVLRCKNE